MAMTDDSAASVSTVRDQPEGAPPSQPVVMLAVRFVLELIAFAAQRLRGRRDAVIPGALWLYLGSVLSVAVWVVLSVLGIGHFR